MKSNYKKLGQFIERCDEKNDGNVIKELRGISNQKYFQKSKTNTIGINLSKYRIVRKGQFAFNRATTRNGDKISIALRQGKDCIVSPSYRIFKSKDENILNSEYLMMWFRRPEFDRYARFKSHGSAHEFFDYDEMCEVELPVPNIEKQRAIVKEYNTVVNRIKLNEELNQKLEETAQALYKQWFVDFNFPITEESCPELVSGSPELIGKPYKSYGGKMVYNEELDKEIPEGWEVSTLEQIIDFKNGKKKPNKNGSIPVYGGNGILGYVNEFNQLNIIVVGRVGAYCGSLFLVKNKCWVSDNAIAGKINNDKMYYAFDLLKSLRLNSKSEGSGQPLLTQGILNSIKFSKPPKYIIELCDLHLEKIYVFKSILNDEIESLGNLQNLLLSKMTRVEVEEELA